MSFFNTLPERAVFQSPRSWKFVSDMSGLGLIIKIMCLISFNPLDRGNLYLIQPECPIMSFEEAEFQSPRSGKFVSDSPEKECHVKADGWFQSPRSGKFVSNAFLLVKRRM